MYALAAGAAGVGMLALAQPAEAKIVYTPAHVKLLGGKPFALDLNHDGVVDFFLLHSYPHVSHGTNGLRACNGINTNGFSVFCSTSTVPANAIRVGQSMGFPWGAALRPGAKIQRGDRFGTQVGFAVGISMGYVGGVHSDVRWLGPWMNGGKGVKDHYLGMKFKISGRFHFGWARITVATTQNAFTATLTGYAYETVPGRAIIAGKTKGPDVVVEPATLGHLAQGAAGISSWRAKRAAAPPNQ